MESDSICGHDYFFDDCYLSLVSQQLVVSGMRTERKILMMKNAPHAHCFQSVPSHTRPRGIDNQHLRWYFYPQLGVARHRSPNDAPLLTEGVRTPRATAKAQAKTGIEPLDNRSVMRRYKGLSKCGSIPNALEYAEVPLDNVPANPTPYRSQRIALLRVDSITGRHQDILQI